MVKWAISDHSSVIIGLPSIQQLYYLFPDDSGRGNCSLGSDGGEGGGEGREGAGPVDESHGGRGGGCEEREGQGDRCGGGAQGQQVTEAGCRGYRGLPGRPPGLIINNLWD